MLNFPFAIFKETFAGLTGKGDSLILFVRCKMWNKAEDVSLRGHNVSHPKIKAADGGYVNKNLPSVLPHFCDPFSYVFGAAATT